MKQMTFIDPSGARRMDRINSILEFFYEVVKPVAAGSAHVDLDRRTIVYTILEHPFTEDDIEALKEIIREDPRSQAGYNGNIAINGLALVLKIPERQYTPEGGMFYNG